MGEFCLIRIQFISQGFFVSISITGVNGQNIKPPPRLLSLKLISELLQFLWWIFMADSYACFMIALYCASRTGQQSFKYFSFYQVSKNVKTDLCFVAVLTWHQQMSSFPQIVKSSLSPFFFKEQVVIENCSEGVKQKRAMNVGELLMKSMFKKNPQKNMLYFQFLAKTKRVPAL